MLPVPAHPRADAQPSDQAYADKINGTQCNAQHATSMLPAPSHPRADVALLDLLRAVHDGGAGGTRDAVVVRLAQPADGADAGLGQVVGRQVRQALRVEGDT